jgi:hypothetical protein
MDRNDAPEEQTRDAVSAHAAKAVARIRKHAKELGLDRLTMGDIDAEIQAARRERKARRAHALPAHPAIDPLGRNGEEDGDAAA